MGKGKRKGTDGSGIEEKKQKQMDAAAALKLRIEQYVDAHPLFDEALVDAIRTVPLIWDIRMSGYHQNRLNRQRLFENVATHLHELGYEDADVELISERWATLREKYTRKRRSIPPSGSEKKKEEIARKWPLFRLMDFLWDVTTPARTEDSLTLGKEFESTEPEKSNAGDAAMPFDSPESEMQQPDDWSPDSIDTFTAPEVISAETDADGMLNLTIRRSSASSGSRSASAMSYSVDSTPAPVPVAPSDLSTTSQAIATTSHGARDLSAARTVSSNRQSLQKAKKTKGTAGGATTSSTAPAVLEMMKKVLGTEDDSSAAIGHFLASEFRSLPESSRTWAVKTVTDFMYQLKAAQECGKVKTFIRSIELALRDSAFLVLTVDDDSH